jgi:predicted RNA polymerase sigma factor
VATGDTHRTVEAIWRIESPRLIAGLARIVRDVGLAEDLAQDALVAALERWPESGVPENPGAWLMAATKHRAVDLLRRRTSLERKYEQLGHELRLLGEASETGVEAQASTEEIGDDRARWDRVLVTRGLVALGRAEELGGAFGPYALQAAIAAYHARALTPEQTDWERIAALYDALAQLAPSPVVELNRAVALGMAFGPAAGLEVVDALREEPALAGYHLLPGVRGDLLLKLGRAAEARAEFERAAALTRNERERQLLLERAAGCS